MNFIRTYIAIAITSLVLAIGGCKTLDTSTPSGWESGGGWQNWRG